ncbi:hypothetical protein CCACVL1_08645 [Corchorus capsularis]|uniref:Retrotransposon gag protein n=1 Tax=Corchorus capsularis TaxID=210143 RepID=A0A1R3IZG2_COCAP|nr:hypothetical protein CCACVL1_08645 [Corchorus capsularis]
MIASASETVVSHIASATSSFDAWEKLNKLYANKSRSRVMALRDKLTIPRGNKSISEYFQLLRGISDELALINTIIPEDELVILALNGAGPEYKELAAGIRARESYISFEELIEKFLDYEEHLQKQQSTADLSIPTANYANKPFARNRSYQGQ